MIKFIVRHLPFITRFILFCAALFLMVDGLIHFTPLRTEGIAAIYGLEMEMFIRFFQMLWGSFAFFVGLIVFEVQRKLFHYRPLLPVLIVFFAIHGVLIIVLAEYRLETILPLPNLHIYNPYYSIELIIQGVAMVLIAGLMLAFYKKYPTDVKKQ